MRKHLLVLAVVAGLVAHSSMQTSTVPAIDDLLNLKRVGAPSISPDGTRVAYTIRETNWDENAYETEIWLGDAATGQSRQVTNAAKSSSQPAWSADGKWLAFVSDRDGKRQIYRIAHRRRRSRPPHQNRRRRHQFRVVTVGDEDRLHDDRRGRPRR